jgi:prevent-host-death family protein
MNVSLTVTATEAKNRLGQMLEQARRGPVFIEKAGRRHSVLLSAEQYDTLLAAGKEPAASPGADPGRAFYERHKAWVDEQNRRVEAIGIWNEEFRRW